MRSSIPILIVLSSFFVTSASADDWPIMPPEPLKEIEMVLVKGGCYTMGDGSDENPAHHVCVKDFYIGKYPVTQMQWTGTMGHNPSKEPNCGITCPVENVSWDDIQAFLRKLDARTGKAYRLPSEAEWEYAARSGGKDEQWAGTSNEKALGDYAWYYDNGGFQSHPVGQKKPNGLGLYDMTGNVWQWTSDPFDERVGANGANGDAKETREGSTDGSANTAPRRALRGGYWGDLASFIRVTRRIGLAHSAHGVGYGFRVVLPASP